MNEERLAKSICRYLDQGTDHVSWRVQQRLEAARRGALAGIPAAAPIPGSAGSGRTAPGPLTGRPVRESPGMERLVPLWWRITATTLPALLVIAGLVIGDALQQEQAIEELAEVDSALLTDDVPLVAYADHGFGVYLKNTRR